MELKEFLEKFLPDYQEKLHQFTIDFIRETGLKVTPIQHCDTFNSKYFPEALQNYTDRICEKQRENCADEYDDYKGKFENWVSFKFNIKKAKQPKIEEL